MKFYGLIILLLTNAYEICYMVGYYYMTNILTKVIIIHRNILVFKKNVNIFKCTIANYLKLYSNVKTLNKPTWYLKGDLLLFFIFVSENVFPIITFIYLYPIVLQVYCCITHYSMYFTI